ncbi:MAG: hypothetical protein ACREC5_08200 [Thermoplasmata archaeon]
MAAMAAEVLAVTPSGIVTARTPGPEFPIEGSRLGAPSLGFSAIVLRVFGPVGRPYLALRPRVRLPAALAARLVGAALRAEG